MKMVAGEEVVISEAEAALYDRQIRLWGLEAQKRYASSPPRGLDIKFDKRLANTLLYFIVYVGPGCCLLEWGDWVQKLPRILPWLA